MTPRPPLMFVVAWLCIMAATPGCSSNTPQRALAIGANATLEASEQIADAALEFDVACRTQTSSVTFEQWSECMQPVYTAVEARRATDRLLRGAQAAWDSRGKDGFAEMAPCLLRAARELLAAVAVFVDDIPPELIEFIAMAEAFVADGEECN